MLQMKMNRSRCVCVCTLLCFLCLSRALKGNVKQVFSIQELTVTGADMMHCEKQPKVCVTSDTDCLHSPADLHSAPENFLNTTCHFLFQESSLTCRWTQIRYSRSEISSSFIFSQAEDVDDCPSILNVLSSFFLIIKTKDLLTQKEMFSHPYPLLMEDIVQAPRPNITSVSVSETSVSVSCSSGKYPVSECRIRYKLLNTEAYTETAGFRVFTECVCVLRGLQFFSVYDLSVSCFYGFGRWSDWSDETRVKTAEKRPSASPALSYYVFSDVNSGPHQLLLLWKALEVREAGGIIQGYEVSYMPIRHPSLKETINTTDLKVFVPVMMEEYEVRVCAFNSAGRSPYSWLTLHTSNTHGVCALRSLWVYSDGSSLRVRWDGEFTAVNLSEFAIQWSEASNPEHTHWRRVNRSTFSSAITDVRQQQVYSISVFPVCERVCGPPSSISADLQHGALLDLQLLSVASVSSSAVCVQWSWQQVNSSVNVRQYHLELSGPQDTHTVSVFPDQQQHWFLNLQPNTQYSVFIRAETTAVNFTRATLDVHTLLLDYEDALRFAVPVLLLLLICGIFSVFTRSICRQYLFPVISNPRFSLIGRWLLSPHLQAEAEVCVLMESVFLMEQQMEKSILQLLEEPDEDLSSSESCADEGTALWRANPDTHTPSSLPEYVHLPVMPDHTHYIHNGQIPAV